MAVEPRWGSLDFVRFFLGCAVVTATPGFVVKPRWGWVRMGKMWVMTSPNAPRPLIGSSLISITRTSCLASTFQLLLSPVTKRLLHVFQCLVACSARGSEIAVDHIRLAEKIELNFRLGP